jgi:peptidoglycan/xylan/chitin deacetylase (PgdA/CDA1 family)
MIYSVGSLEQEAKVVRVVTGVDQWRLPILRYRSVPHHSPETAAPRSVPAVRLEEHLSFLVTAGFQLLGLSEALRALREDGSRRVVALTFDDALLDFLNAFDLLERFGARATLYVPTDTVGMRVSRWDRGLSRLSWYDLQEIAVAHFEIGSQSVSSRHLDFRSDAAVFAQVRDSKQEIEDHLGLRVESFCSAGGHSSHRLRRAVGAAGYSNACSTFRRVARTQDDVFNLPRLRVKPSATGCRVDGLLRSGGGGNYFEIADSSHLIAQRTVTRITRSARCATRRRSTP